MEQATETVQWISINWWIFPVGFYIAEKVVKLTPIKADDILIDIIWGGIKKAVGK